MEDSVQHGAFVVLLLAASAIATWRPLRIDPMPWGRSVDVEPNPDPERRRDQERGEGALRVGGDPEPTDVGANDPTSVHEEVHAEKHVRREVSARLPLSNAE